MTDRSNGKFFLQKSDGDLVSLSSYDTCEAGSGHVSHVSARVSVSGYFSPSSSPELGHSMVPCKQKNSAPTSPNSFISFKESDSNGNDIRKVDNILWVTERKPSDSLIESLNIHQARINSRNYRLKS